MEMVKTSEKPKKRPVKLWTYFRLFIPTRIVPMKLSEWNIIPRPVMHRSRQEIAITPVDDPLKGIRGLYHSRFHVIHPLPSCPASPGSSGVLGPWMM